MTTKNRILTALLIAKKVIGITICSFFIISCQGQDFVDFQKIDKSKYKKIDNLIRNTKNDYQMDSVRIVTYLMALIETLDSVNGVIEGQDETWEGALEYEVYTPFYSDTLKIIDFSDMNDEGKGMVFNSVRILESNGLTNRILVRFYNYQNNRTKEIYEYKPRTHNTR